MGKEIGIGGVKGTVTAGRMAGNIIVYEGGEGAASRCAAIFEFEFEIYQTTTTYETGGFLQDLTSWSPNKYCRA